MTLGKRARDAEHGFPRELTLIVKRGGCKGVFRELYGDDERFRALLDAFPFHDALSQQKREFADFAAVAWHAQERDSEAARDALRTVERALQQVIKFAHTRARRLAFEPDDDQHGECENDVGCVYAPCEDGSFERLERVDHFLVDHFIYACRSALKIKPWNLGFAEFDHCRQNQQTLRNDINSKSEAEIRKKVFAQLGTILAEYDCAVINRALARTTSIAMSDVFAGLVSKKADATPQTLERRALSAKYYCAWMCNEHPECDLNDARVAKDMCSAMDSLATRARLSERDKEVICGAINKPVEKFNQWFEYWSASDGFTKMSALMQRTVDRLPDEHNDIVRSLREGVDVKKLLHKHDRKTVQRAFFQYIVHDCE